jgi:putative ABC transport system ATP-binding protein
MIRARGVSRTYQGSAPERAVLSSLDLDVRVGEMVAIVGPSGCGKTTLLHVLAGLDRGYSGTVEVGGSDLATLGDAALADLRRQRIGVVFQALHLLDHLDAVDNVALPWLFARGSGTLSAREAGARAAEALARVGLADRGRARPRVLSGGERQRVAFARALFNRPPLLLCDELTGNLDRASGATVLELLREHRERAGGTVVVVTHDPDVVAAADRTLVLRDGRLEPVGAGGRG